MKEPIPAHLYNRLKEISEMTPWNVPAKLKEFLETLRPKILRTSKQNKAIHVDCELIAEKLNDAGKDMRAVLKQEIQIPWTMESVKEYIFKPIMKAMYQLESTTELEKNDGKIEKIHAVVMRELGEKHGIEYHVFPNDPKKKQDLEESMSIPKPLDIEYPEDDEALADKF